jgi:hypothetical protein
MPLAHNRLHATNEVLSPRLASVLGVLEQQEQDDRQAVAAP